MLHSAKEQMANSAYLELRLFLCRSKHYLNHCQLLPPINSPSDSAALTNYQQQRSELWRNNRNRWSASAIVSGVLQVSLLAVEFIAADHMRKKIRSRSIWKSNPLIIHVLLSSSIDRRVGIKVIVLTYCIYNCVASASLLFIEEVVQSGINLRLFSCVY